MGIKKLVIAFANAGKSTNKKRKEAYLKASFTKINGI
jgi:hypothetical protein